MKQDKVLQEVHRVQARLRKGRSRQERISQMHKVARGLIKSYGLKVYPASKARYAE